MLCLQVIIPWIKFCPQPKHNKWVLPVLESVPHIHKKIKDGWSALEDDQPEDVEIEVFWTYLQCLRSS